MYIQYLDKTLSAVLVSKNEPKKRSGFSIVEADVKSLDDFIIEKKDDSVSVRVFSGKEKEAINKLKAELEISDPENQSKKNELLFGLNITDEHVSNLSKRQNELIVHPEDVSENLEKFGLAITKQQLKQLKVELNKK